MTYRASPREDGTLDEFVATNPKAVHLEQMADDSWSLIVDLADGRQALIQLATHGRKPHRSKKRRAQKAQRIFGTVEVERA
jgi:hypothetical protein